jgi:FkbH-like protein
MEWETRHTGNLDEYLADLGLVVDLAIADEFAIPRVAQLINKTNQFNLTTRRDSEATVRALAASDRHEVYAARVRDRFGDHGLVGGAILSREDDAWVVDSFLLSCRVLGRGVETAILSGLVGRVRDEGGGLLRGLFVPTEKNAPARDFYERHGFRLRGEHEGMQEWELEVGSGDVQRPPWLTLNVATRLLEALPSAR